MGHTLNSIYRYYSGKVCTFVLGQMQFDPTLGLGLGQICVYLQNSVLITSPNASQKKSVLPIIRSAIALYLSKGLHTLVTAMLYCVCTLLLVSCWGCFLLGLLLLPNALFSLAFRLHSDGSRPYL